MSPPQFKAPQGTHDILPPDSARWQRLLALFAGEAGRAGYGLLASPMFEEYGVFQRVGESTDVVRKEMYDFRDKGERHLALRPEGTASAVRAFIQHHPAHPWKVWYAAPSFRYERPQAGRYRQHHQMGVEALGSGDPDLDVEVIALAWRVLRGIGLTRVLLLINSMGDRECRTAYLEQLSAFLTENLGDLAEQDRETAQRHPMRVLDSKRKATRDVIGDAPRLIDHLSDGAAAHFDRVQAGLGALGIPFAIEPRLVRGFDYYTHTTFEFQSSALEGAQNAVGGGGRYDGLAVELGGDDTPGVGFGLGVERLLLAADAEGVFGAPPSPLHAFVVDVTGGEQARDLVEELRAAGLGADRAYDGKSMRAQMKAADRSGAAVALIVGERELDNGEVAVRHLRLDQEQDAIPRSQVVEWVRTDAVLGH